MNCDEICERVDAEDVFFMVVFICLYVAFHAVGVVLLIQPETVSKVIGGFWLLMCIILFNYGLYKIVCESCYVNEAKVHYRPREHDPPPHMSIRSVIV